jgi:hypothetical protein
MGLVASAIVLVGGEAAAQPVPYSAGAEAQTQLQQMRTPEPPLPLRTTKRGPVRTRWERSFHPVLVASGGSLFGFSYLLSVVLARAAPAILATPEQLAANPGLDRPLFAPVVGPLLAIGQHERTDGQRALIGLVAVGQLTGLGVFCAGLAIRRWRLVPVDDGLAVNVGPGHAGVTGSF